MSEPPTFGRVEALFLAACRLETDARPGFLQAECGDDPTLLREVMALLEEDDPADTFLEQSALKSSFDLDALAATDRPMPEHVGPYRIIRRIGAGGMGVVYEAEQESPRRRVALKVIQSGRITRELLQRFRHEAHVLAQLRHPGIAHIYESGVDADRQPFFAMELVNGPTLVEYAERRGLDTRARLDLITAVGDSVHHAHQKGVIHRDLKPSNILVDEDTGQPKILDFGVARTDADLQTITIRTDVGQLVGTIPYMSPEQASADRAALDTRSDVYALGVITYEMLTGRLPYDVIDTPLPEALRRIQEVEPVGMSSINRECRGDIETIVRKALEKERTRRYQSAAEMVADIRRYLHDEPVLARPTSVVYQLRKFARRNKALVGGIAAVFIVMLVGVVTTSWGMALAIAAKEDESVQREITEAVNAYLNDDLLAASDPYNTRDRDITMREVLDIAAEKIEGKFVDRPLVEAAIRTTLGRSYRNLAEYDLAQRHLSAALDLRRSTLPIEHADTLESMDDLAVVHYWAGEHDRAEAILLEALEIGRPVLGDEHPLSLRLQGNLGLVYDDLSRFAEAEALYLQNHEACLRVHGPEHEESLTAKARLAAVYVRQGRFDEAVPLSNEVLERRRSVLGDDHPDTIGALNNLGSLYVTAGRWSEAEPFLSEALDLMTRVLGSDHAHTMACMRNLAQVYSRQGRSEDAERLLRTAYETDLRNHGEEHPGTLNSMNDLAQVYRSQGRLEDAEQLVRRALGISRRVRGDQHSHTIVYMSTLASIHVRQERYEDAAVLYQSAIAAKRAAFPEGHWHIGAFLHGLGKSYTSMGEYADAEAALLEAHEILHDAMGSTNARTIAVIRSTIDLYAAWDKPSRAAALRALLPDPAD